MLSDLYARAQCRRMSRSQSSVANWIWISDEGGDEISIVAPEADDNDVPDLDRVERISLGGFLGGLVAGGPVDFNLELLRTGPDSSPFGSIDFRSRLLCRIGNPWCGVSTGFFRCPPRGLLTAGGRESALSGFTGVEVGVERKEAGREGNIEDIILGNGRREGAGS